MKTLCFVLAAIWGLAVSVLPASADMVYTLNTDKDFSTGHDFGAVTLTVLSSTEVQVKVQLNTTIAGMGFANTGAGYAIAWDLKGGAVDTIAVDTTLTPNSGDFAVQKTAGNYEGSYKASPFTSGANGSKFEYAIDYKGATGSDKTLVFDVTRNTGLALSDFATGNTKYQFAVDIITTAGSTRDVAVPEPKTWTMSLAGLMGLAGLMMVGRRRKPVRAA